MIFDWFNRLLQLEMCLKLLPRNPESDPLQQWLGKLTFNGKKRAQSGSDRRTFKKISFWYQNYMLWKGGGILSFSELFLLIIELTRLENAEGFTRAIIWWLWHTTGSGSGCAVHLRGMVTCLSSSTLDLRSCSLSWRTESRETQREEQKRHYRYSYCTQCGLRLMATSLKALLKAVTNTSGCCRTAVILH